MKYTIGKYTWKECEVIHTFKANINWDYSWISFIYNPEYNEVTYEFFGYDKYHENDIYKGELPYNEYCHNAILYTLCYNPKELFDLCLNKKELLNYEYINDISDQFHSIYINWFNTIFKQKNITL